MGQSVELDEEVYDRIEALGRTAENVSETIGRLIEGPSLLDLVGAFDGDDVTRVRESRNTAASDEQSEIGDLRQRIGERFERAGRPDTDGGAEGREPE